MKSLIKRLFGLEESRLSLAEAVVFLEREGIDIEDLDHGFPSIDKADAPDHEKYDIAFRNLKIRAVKANGSLKPVVSGQYLTQALESEKVNGSWMPGPQIAYNFSVFDGHLTLGNPKAKR